jgi:hypothetical protein
MKKFAENRPGDTRALADRALSRSLTLLALILYTSALRGARGRASALSRMCTRAARRTNLKHPQLSERRMIIKTRRTHPQIYSIRTSPTCGRALKVEQERHVSEAASRAETSISRSHRVSCSQGWTDDSTQPAKGQCTSSSWSCSIQLTVPSTLAKFAISNYHLFTSLAESDFMPFSVHFVYTRWCF